MNKKFSTLMAGLMLASAFSVADAQKVVEKYETNKAYWLGIEANSFNMATGTDEQVIAVVSNPKAANYGQLILVKKAELDNICAVKAATWTIAYTQPTDGTAPKFTYVNKATGLTLSLDPAVAEADDNTAFIKGSSSEWLNTAITNNDHDTNFTPLEFAPLRSFYEANKAVFLYEGTEDAGKGTSLFGTEVTKNNDIIYTELFVGVSKNTTDFSFNGKSAIKVAPVQPMILPLDEKALNSQLGKLDLDVVSDDQAWFNLYFNQDVTSDAEKNLFAATPLKASQLYKKADGSWTFDKTAGNPTEYVRLTAKGMDGAYITVDTAYHTGTEIDGKLVKFTYAKGNYEGTNNVARLAESAYFAFAYNPYTDQVLIKSCAYSTRSAGPNNTPKEIVGADGNTAYSYWTGTQVKNAYIRLAKLASVRELTVATNESNHMVGDWFSSTSEGMSTTVKMSQDDLTFSPATIADGLYLIKLHTSGYDKDGNKREEANGDYLIASLKGNFGYAEQAKNQNYDHMPAAQWLVQKEGTSETAPIKVINREFFDRGDFYGYFGVDGNAIQAFNAGDGKIFFTTGAFQNDTLEFIPVSAASKKDSKLGYKYVDEKQASVETYYFNYLSGLAQDKGLNTPSDKDSLVRVDETGDKIALRLIPVVKDDNYGQQLDEKETGVAKLIRNAYYIEAYDNLKFAADGRSRYLSYEPSSKKYVMSLVPEMFFLKENNDIDGTHYYALVKANTYGATIYDMIPSDENGDKVMDHVKGWASNNLLTLRKTMYPAVYAGKDIRTEANVWTFEDLALEKEKKVSVTNNGVITEITVNNPLTEAQRREVKVIFYDKNGEPIISDASEGVDLYAYMANADSPVISLQRVATKESIGGSVKSVYYAMNPNTDLFQHSIEGYWAETSLKRPTDFANVGSCLSGTTDYANSRISVDDNTLDLFKAQLNNQTWANELRVSAFEAQVNDSPLYRRFNGANGEYGTEANAPLNLKFFRHNNNAEYLFENYASENEYRDGINDKEISFLGINNAFQFPESETRSYTMFVDTAYVRANTRMPQYLIGIRPEVVLGDTTLCDATTHQHKTPEEALACEHTKINVGFTRAMYLFNAQDSVDVKNYDYQGKAAYGAQGYTRLAFKDAVHANDTLYILNPGVTTEELKACNLKNDKLFAKKIALDNNKHKNVVFQFRLVTDEDNRFLIESEAEENGKAVFNKDLKNVSVAPMRGGWVKIQNGVPVIARFDDFNEAIAQAEIFDVNDEIKYDATANDEIAVEGVTVVAGNGQVTIMGAAGKNVTITNILGKVIASQVIASDNATIAVPAGIVAVAVEGEAAVKAIVK